MAVQASWNLDSTADSLIGISRNGLAAATTDDVQLIALEACERFGATLAMSHETIHKIQVSVIPTPSPAILNFLKVSVGYRANDSVNYFGQNTAGLRFLGLACALITLEDQYKAATILHNMLESSTDDKRRVPTPRQLRQLLVALGPRCHRSGFTDEIVGWHLLLEGYPRFERKETMRHLEIKAPDGKALNSVVDALRQLNRLGNADITGITIKTAEYAAWFAAFVKWSIGYPPSVVYTDGSFIIQQPASKVTIVIPLDDNGALSPTVSVTIYSAINRPSELISPASPISAAGMISLPMHGRAMLQHWHITSEAARAAFREAMPYALSNIIHIVQTRAIRHLSQDWSESSSVDDTESGKSTIQSPTDGVQATPLCPFPERSVISGVFEMLFGMEIEPLPCIEWVDIFELQHVASYMAQCCCLSKCIKRNGKYPVFCLKTKFADIIGEIVYETLTLSLINNPEGFLVPSMPYYGRCSSGTHGPSIQAALCARSTIPNIRGREFALSALRFLGHHDAVESLPTPVLSYTRGQTVWPTVYETMGYSKHGYLSFSWYPGHILHRNETFDSVRWQVMRSNIAEPFSERAEGVAVTGPCNLYPDIRVEWNVAVEFDKLYMHITLGSDAVSYMGSGLGEDVLDNLEKVILVEQCPHHRDDELLGPDIALTFTGPVKPFHGKADGIRVVAVDNDEKLGIIAVAECKEKELAMVRGDACINCCIKQCRKLGSRVLIL